MSLNIKNQDALRLAQELSALTGESMDTAVTEAVRERLMRVRERQQSSAERLIAIGANCTLRLKEPFRSVDHADLLYGPDGLPR